MDGMSCSYTMNHAVKKGYLWIGCPAWHTSTTADDGYTTTTYHQHLVLIRCKLLTAAACCILPAMSVELSKHQTHIYIPPLFQKRDAIQKLNKMYLLIRNHNIN